MILKRLHSSIICFIILIVSANAQKDYSAEVSALLSNMSLADKVGEMTQLSLDVLCVGEPYNVTEPVTLDREKMDYILNELRVGSILNVAGHAYTKEKWQKIITEIQSVATEKKASGIPVLYGIDGIHGMNYTLGATLFPQQINLAATWNPAHARNTGEVVAYEARASFIPWNFSPVFDLARDPRWPRFWETFGEDPYLSAEIGVSMVDGMQGEDVSSPYHVAACMKHFLGYSLTLRGKDRTQSWIPDRYLKEIFTPSFKAAIDAGAKTIMINSGEINGIPVHANPAILQDLLRNELGFKGLVVSDWEDIIYLCTRHKIAKDHKDAIRIAVNAGIDMSMVAVQPEFPILLKELVEEGKIPMSRIDEAVTRILTLKYELGLFEQAIHPDTDYSKFGSEEFRKMSYDAAVESIILLKNKDSILPLKEGQRILLTGPTSNSLNFLNGGWTGVWQGNNPKYNTPGKQTIKEAFEMKFGQNNVIHHMGSNYDTITDIEETISAAKSVDVIVACVGEETYTETPGNINDINLPVAQNLLMQRLAATEIPIILIYVGGRPRIIREMESVSSAVIAAMLPGNEGGHALASLLSGEQNPSGRLPFTYPKYPNDLVTYDFKGTDKVAADYSLNGFDPQYEFGFGLSYTTYEYSNLKINKEAYAQNEMIEVSVDVSNSGQLDGMETVQIYIRDLIASITPPDKRLRAFRKVKIAAGETQTVSFEIPISRLAFVGIDKTWSVEAGGFELIVDDLVQKFEVK